MSAILLGRTDYLLKKFRQNAHTCFVQIISRPITHILTLKKYRDYDRCSKFCQDTKFDLSFEMLLRDPLPSTDDVILENYYCTNRPFYSRKNVYALQSPPPMVV